MTNVIFGLLLLAVPATVVAEHLHFSPIVVMVLACVGIIPLAKFMGQATEHLSSHVGPTGGGVLNATFGNACELIIAFFAVKAGLLDVVKASLTGSILGNILLVLGASMLAGGLKYETQTFSKMTAATGSKLLMIIAFVLVLPATGNSGPPVPADEVQRLMQHLSIGISGVLILLYLLGLFFSLGTHKHLFVPTVTAEDDDIKKPWPVWLGIAILAASTVAIAVLSEYLVDNVEQAASSIGMTPVFIGVFVLAIIGNAAENSTAVLMARKNKMDLSVSIALGSSTQIALFVAPVTVLVGYFMGQPMDLLFSHSEIIAVIAAVFICFAVLFDGESDWFEGALLLGLYVCLGMKFYFLG
jgi:Ca2+:H+ antiporter